MPKATRTVIAERSIRHLIGRAGWEVSKLPTVDHYALDVDVAEDFSRFNALHPRLAIVTSDYWRFEDTQLWVFLLSTLLGATGMAMVLYPVAVWIRKNDYRVALTWPGPLTRGFVWGTGSLASEILEPKRIRLFPWVWVALAAAIGGICGYIDIPPRWIAALGIAGAGLVVLGWMVRLAPRCNPVRLDISPNSNQNVQWARRLPLRRPITGWPGFGLFGGTIFAIFAIIMMMITPSPIIPKGEWVHLLKAGELPAKSDSWTEPLIVTVKDNGAFQEPRLFMNSREVPWIDLDRKLKQELAPRKDWVVYVGGDDAIAYQYVADVVDAARGRGAKVVLITEKNKHSAEN